MLNHMPGYYATRVVHEQTPRGPRWIASHPHLPGCVAVVKDPADALAELAEVLPQWLERAAVMGKKIPKRSSDFYYDLVLNPELSPADHTGAAPGLLGAFSGADPLVTLFVPTS